MRFTILLLLASSLTQVLSFDPLMNALSCLFNSKLFNRPTELTTSDSERDRLINALQAESDYIATELYHLKRIMKQERVESYRAQDDNKDNLHKFLNLAQQIKQEPIEHDTNLIKQEPSEQPANRSVQLITNVTQPIAAIQVIKN